MESCQGKKVVGDSLPSSGPSRRFFPVRWRKSSGCIINMSSVASSIKGVPSRLAYTATKAAVIGLTKSVAADYVGKGIRCNAICPGTVQSPSLEDCLCTLGDYEKARAAFVARQPIGRLGTPEEIADPFSERIILES